MSAAILRFEARSAPAAGQRPGLLQRGDGAAEIGFALRGGRSALADLYQRTPCRVLFPRVEADEPPVAVVLTTSGGLTGGDRLRLAITVGEEAAAVVTTQAAEKIYRVEWTTPDEPTVWLAVHYGDVPVPTVDCSQG